MTKEEREDIEIIAKRMDKVLKPLLFIAIAVVIYVYVFNSL